MSSTVITSIRCSRIRCSRVLLITALVISSLLVSGCSGSSESGSSQPSSGNAQLTNENDVLSDDEQNTPADTGSINNGEMDDSTAATTGDSSDDSSDGIVTEPSPDSLDNTLEESANDIGADADIAEPDPVVPISTQVMFDITVPVYVSNSLQVQITWNDKTLSAMWVGDEYWSTTTELPTNTEHLLVVTFYDQNGDIVLGSFEKNFRTGINAFESFTVTADQFDIDRWDSDSDGENNLNESIAGTDPLVDDMILLDVRDAYELYDLDYADSLEAELPQDRPYILDDRVEADTEADYPWRSSTRTIDLDENGTGNLFIGKSSFSSVGHITSNSVGAVRTNTGNSIIWMGAYLQNDTEELRSGDEDFSVETTRVDETTRTLVLTIDFKLTGGSPINSSTSYSFTGTVITGTTQCEAISGTYDNDYNPIGSFRYASTTKIVKEPGDRYWKVNRTTFEGEEEYYVKSVGTFECILADLQ